MGTEESGRLVWSREEGGFRGNGLEAGVVSIAVRQACGHRDVELNQSVPVKPAKPTVTGWPPMVTVTLLASGAALLRIVPIRLSIALPTVGYRLNT